MNDVPEFQEKRRSVRLVGALSVDMTFPGVPKMQHGYTYDINQQGLGVEADYLDLDALGALMKGNLTAEVVVHLNHQKKVRSRCQVVWFHKDDEMTEEKYLIGFKFQEINPAELKLLLSRAKIQTKWLGVIVAGLFILMLMFLGYILS